MSGSVLEAGTDGEVLEEEAEEGEEAEERGAGELEGDLPPPNPPCASTSRHLRQGWPRDPLEGLHGANNKVRAILDILCLIKKGIFF